MVLLYFLDEIVTRYFKLYIIFENSLIITVSQQPQDPGALLPPLNKIVKSVKLYLKSSSFESFVPTLSVYHNSQSCYGSE